MARRAVEQLAHRAPELFRELEQEPPVLIGG